MDPNGAERRVWKRSADVTDGDELPRDEQEVQACRGAAVSPGQRPPAAASVSKRKHVDAAASSEP